MTAMNTDQLVQVALDRAATTAADGDSAVLYPGTRISHVLLTAQVDVGTLFMARQLGYHAVIGYYQPTGTVAQQWQSFQHLQSAWMVQQGIGAAALQRYFTNNAPSLQLQMQQHDESALTAVATMLDLPLILMHAPIARLAQQQLQAIVAPLLSETATNATSLRISLAQPQPFAAAQAIILGSETTPSGRIAVDVGWQGMLAADAVRMYIAQGFDTIVTGTIDVATALPLLHEHAHRTVIALGYRTVASIGGNIYTEVLRQANIEVTLL